MQFISSRAFLISLSLLGFVLAVGCQVVTMESNGLVLALWVMMVLFALVASLIIWQQQKFTLIKNDSDAKTAGKSGITHSQKTDWILDALAGGVITTNLDGTVLYLNSSAETLTGYTYQEALDMPLLELLKIEDSSHQTIIKQILVLQNAKEAEHHLQFENVKLSLRDGSTKYLELHVIRAKLDLEVIVFIFRDLDTDRKVINRLYQQAAYDPLTGLMNRRSFEQYLEQIVKSPGGANRNHVLVSIDLDNFKIVNDTSGHQAGDELLKQVATMFQRAVRRSDKVARLGGDEFAILLEDCLLDKASNIMESVLRELRGFRFSWQGKVFNVAASMGLLEFLSNENTNIVEMFANVDKACYTAKALGRNQLSIYVDKYAKTLVLSDQRQTDWAKLLQEAMQYDRFILFVQPILPLQEENAVPFVQYEVLLRLPFKKSLLSPGSFLPAADRLDMMARIDRWIIRRVLQMIADNNLYCHDGIEPRLMINLSSQAVQDAGLFDYIHEQIKVFGTNPKLLCFEISESVAIANFVQTKRLMRALSGLGVSLVLDDFGSGFSSLNYIRDLPLSYLKIDGNFVHNLVANPVDAAMVKAVHEVGQVMNLYTIAELVEDSETLEQLRMIGINFAQGYYCGRPFAFTELCQTGIHPVNVIGKSANT